MTLRHLQIYVAVCDEMSMTAAARSLFMSQPAVSQAISELEGHYQVRLFERLSRKLYLTQAGEKLLGYARHIIRMHKDAETEMRSMNQKSWIRIGASVTIGSFVLPKVLAAFSKAYPNIQTEVIEENTAKIEQLLLVDQLDIGLVEGDLTEREFIHQPFLEDDLVLICGCSHPFGHVSSIRPEQLQGENFILRELGSGTRKTFETVMLQNSLSWSSTWTCSNADTIKMAVAEGLGISVISRRAVSKEVEMGQLRCVPIDNMRFRRTFKVTHHKNKYMTDALLAFVASVKTSSEDFESSHGKWV